MARKESRYARNRRARKADRTNVRNLLIGKKGRNGIQL